MTKYLFLSISLFFVHTSAAQPQMSLNQEAAQAYQKADAELNKIYQSILAEYKQDATFLENLKISQRLWIKFRDAEVKMKYPEPREYYGSIYQVCISNYLETLTRKRVNTLKVWLDGVEEGNVCSGSVKTKIWEPEGYQIQSNSFMGVATGDPIAQKMSVLTKDILRTGEGDFDVFSIKNNTGKVLANVFPDPMDASKVGDITVISPMAKTIQGVHVGMTFGELEKKLGPVAVYGSEIEDRTSAVKDNFSYRLDANFWSYNIDKSKIDKGTRIIEITIRR